MTHQRSCGSWAMVEGVPLFARRWGQRGRPPVVLVHGLLVSSRYMSRLGRDLQHDYEVWAPDMPGFGLSGDPLGVPDVPELGSWLTAWLGAHDLADVTLVANSFGCQYAVEMLTQAPQQVSRAVLLGPTMDPQARSALSQGLRFALNAPMEPLMLGAIVMRDLLDCGLQRVAATYQHALRHAIELSLPRVPVPTLIVRGERDPLVPQRWVRDAAALMPRARVEVLEGAAHTINYNAPRRTAALIDRFIQESTG